MAPLGGPNNRTQGRTDLLVLFSTVASFIVEKLFIGTWPKCFYWQRWGVVVLHQMYTLDL